MSEKLDQSDLFPMRDLVKALKEKVDTIVDESHANARRFNELRSSERKNSERVYELSMKYGEPIAATAAIAPSPTCQPYPGTEVLHLANELRELVRGFEQIAELPLVNAALRRVLNDREK